MQLAGGAVTKGLADRNLEAEAASDCNVAENCGYSIVVILQYCTIHSLGDRSRLPRVLHGAAVFSGVEGK